MNGNATTNSAAIDWITRTLAVMGGLCVVTVCVLSYKGVQIPPELNTLTGGLVGSLGAMLVKTTPTTTPPPPSDPVPPIPGNPPEVVITQPVGDPPLRVVEGAPTP